MTAGDSAFRWLGIVISGCLFGALSAHGETAEQLVESGALSGTDNPALIAFLLTEGKSTPTPELHKTALDQAVASLQARAEVTPAEQLSAALSTAIGMAMQVSGDDVVSGAGAAGQ